MRKQSKTRTYSSEAWTTLLTITTLPCNMSYSPSELGKEAFSFYRLFHFPGCKVFHIVGLSNIRSTTGRCGGKCILLLGLDFPRSVQTLRRQHSLEEGDHDAVRVERVEGTLEISRRYGSQVDFL